MRALRLPQTAAIFSTGVLIKKSYPLFPRVPHHRFHRARSIGDAHISSSQYGDTRRGQPLPPARGQINESSAAEETTTALIHHESEDHKPKAIVNPGKEDEAAVPPPTTWADFRKLRKACMNDSLLPNQQPRFDEPVRLCLDPSDHSAEGALNNLLLVRAMYLSLIHI